MTDTNQEVGRLEDWEFMFRQRVGSSPQDVSVNYAVILLVVLFKFRDLVKEIPEDQREELTELDDDYNDLVAEASKAFYRMGWRDALQQQQNTDEGVR